MSVLSAVSGGSVDQVPVGVRANMVPAEIVVSSNLAEDTVIAYGMDVAGGVNKQALFANPFSGGGEELLFIDLGGGLMWARHVNPDTEVGEPLWAPRGWVSEPVLAADPPGGCEEVVVAVHPNGGVFAFVLISEPTGPVRQLLSFELVADPTVPGGQRWKKDIWVAHERPLAGLQVYYCTDRPATPFVFVTDPTEPRLLWWAPSYPSDPAAGRAWHRGGEFVYDQADQAVPVVAGVDSPVEVGSVPAVSVVRLWSVVEGSLFLTTHWPSQGPGYNRWQVTNAAWTGLVGAFAHPAGAGVVGTTRGGNLELAVGLEGIAERLLMPPLDQSLGDLVAWQDAENHLHLYGRDKKAVLNAVHQTGWADEGLYGLLVPVWDSHQATGGEVVTTRPLVGHVASYAVDAFPDFMPNQHVMHQGVPAPEACAMYTQDVRTSFWSQEKIRHLPPAGDALPAPYPVARYQTSVVVKNGYGAPMAGVGVELSADVPVDLEVAGQFYRTGAITPLTLTTDLRGQVTLRVVAAGLTVPDLYLTVPGLDQSLTIQMAGDVHKFLAGNATLPNFGDGFTAQVVQDATTPAGTPLFPHLAPADTPDPVGLWQPTAAQVVAWCAGAFAIDTDSPLPAPMTTGLAPGEQVLAFGIQTHDPDRPGYQVYTSTDQLEARRQALEAKDGLFTDLEDWVGDVWQGIRQGVTAVTEVTIYSQDKLIDLAVTLADGTLNILHLTWDDILGAAQAVEAVFVAIGATIQDTLAWLKWAFDFTDAFLTAQAMTSAIGQIPGLLEPVLTEYEHLAHDFFTTKKQEVEDWFEAMKAGFQGQTVANVQNPSAPPPQTRLPTEGNALADQAGGPHCNWLAEKIMGVPTSSGTLALPPDVDDAFDELWKALNVSPDALAHLSAAWDDFGKLFTNLFDGGDAQTIIAKELVVILDLLEHVIEAVLKYADDVVAGIIAWAKDAVKKVADLFAEPLDDVPLISTVWHFMVESAGLDPVKHPLTIGSLAMLVGAYPATLLYKMVMGAAPFPEGKMPELAAHGGSAALPADQAQDILRLHVFIGLYRLSDLFFYPVLDYMCLTPATGRLGPYPRVPSNLYSQVTTMNRLVLYAVFGWAGWFAKNPAKPGDAGAAYWVPWVLKGMWCVADVYAGKYKGEPMERYRRVLWRYQLEGVCAAVGFACLISAASIIWETSSADWTWFDFRQFAMNALPSVPWVLGLVRGLYDHFPSPVTGGVVMTELFVSSGAIAYWGIQLALQAIGQLSLPPTIQGAAGPIDFGAIERGGTFTSPDIKVAGGFPIYRWSLVTKEGQTGPPPTVSNQPWEFGNESPLPDYPNQIVQMHAAGVLGDPGTTYTFSLRVDDNYPGPGTDERDCTLTVLESPVASFKILPDGGPAPLEVQFFDTSSGPPTAWLYDFGDGQTSTSRNPSHTYPAPGTYPLSLVVTNALGTSHPFNSNVTVT